MEKQYTALKINSKSLQMVEVRVLSPRSQDVKRTIFGSDPLAIHQSENTKIRNSSALSANRWTGKAVNGSGTNAAS